MTLDWSVNLNPYRLSARLDVAEMDARLDEILPRLADLGATMVRTDFLWAFLVPKEYEPDRQAVSWMRHFLDRLAERGIRTYAILYNPPRWASELAHTDEPLFLDAWRDYVDLCAAEFGDRVSLWQVWNEPNNYFSHVKDDFNLFTHHRLKIAGWELDLPYKVRWDALCHLYRLARGVLGREARIVTNLLANMGNMAPVSFPDWIEWDVFLERMLERLHDTVDVIAIDHYPDTWVPGTGPYDWEPLDVLIRKVKDPASACFGKAVIVGEMGYSSCRNAKLPLGLNFFPEDHTEERMADWYAHALPLVAARVGPQQLPGQDLHVVNLYELIDAEPQSIQGTLDLVDIEYHFGLLRADATPKLSFDVCKDIMAGRIAHALEMARARSGPLQVYLEASRMSRGLHRWAGPKLHALYQAVTPPMRHHDRVAITFGALWMIFRALRRMAR